MGTPTAARPAAAALTCVRAPSSLVFDVTNGLKRPATGLRDAVVVATGRAGGEFSAAVVAAHLVGAPGVATWGINRPVNDPGSLSALNDVAWRYSNWGTLAQPGSEADKERQALLASAAERKALSCAASPASAGKAPPEAKGQCKLRQGADVIEWVETPGQQATAQRLGDVDYVHCTRTWDPKELAKETAPGPGFCTAVASLTANPGYNFDAVPARKPKGILGEAGAAC